MMKLIQGDCLEKMKDIETGSVDMILQDPPYNTTACEWEWDIMEKIDALWSEWRRIVKPNGAIVIFGAEPFSSRLRLSNLKMYKYDLYWLKENPTNFFQLKRRFGKSTEVITIFYSKQCTYNPQKYTVDYRVTNKPSDRNAKFKSVTTGKYDNKILPYKDDGTRYPNDILKFNREKLGSTQHPTQKPVALMEYLIKTYTNEGETIFDGFMGSGTTGVASVQTNRNFIGIELDEKYFSMSKDRITKASTSIEELFS